MDIERGEGFRFATPEQLETLYRHAEEQTQALGWPLRDSPLYGHREGVPISDIGLRYGLAVTQREARRMSGGLCEALGSFTTMSIGFYEEHYAPTWHDQDYEYNPPHASFSIYRKRKNPLEEDMLTVTRYERYGRTRYQDGHTYFWRQEEASQNAAARMVGTLNSWQMERELGLDRITIDEASALTMITAGLPKLLRLRKPWRRLSFLHPAD